MKIPFLVKTMIFAICFALSSTFAFSQGKITLQPGEDLEYEVSLYNVKLGKIRIVTEENVDLNGVKVYKTVTYMNSYDGIPFVDLATVYTSWIDPSISFSYKFEGNTKLETNKWQFQRIIFDYDNNYISNLKWEDKVQTEDNSMKYNQKVNDGGSLFFLARQYMNMKRSVKIPTLIDAKIGTTYLNFIGKKENITIPAIKYPIKTIYLNGKADWEGIYGLSGKFEGWFSDDDARVPIKAKMNVYVGSVVIELIKWKREGWTAPKGS